LVARSDLAQGVVEKPGVNLPIVLAGNFLPDRFPSFVVERDVGLAVEVDILRHPYRLPLLIVMGPKVHFAVTIGVLFLADDLAPLIVEETCGRLLAIGRFG
jgi:hypothetical protein